MVRRHSSFSVGPVPSSSEPVGSLRASSSRRKKKEERTAEHSPNSPIHRSATRRNSSSSTLAEKLLGLRPQGLSPLRILQQASPFQHWVKSEEDFRMLAKFFTLHRFSPRDHLPESPFCLVATGLVSLHTDTGAHEVVTHGRGSFFVSVSAALDVTKRQVSRSLLARLCGWKGDDTWDEWIFDDDEDEIEYEAVGARPPPHAPASTNHQHGRLSRGDQRRPSGGSFAGNHVSRHTGGHALGTMQHERRKVSMNPAAAGGERVSIAAQTPEGRALLRRASANTRASSAGASGGPGGLSIPTIRKPHTRMVALTDCECLLMSSGMLKRLHQLSRVSPVLDLAMQHVSTLEASLLRLPLFASAHLNNFARLHLRDLVSYRSVSAGVRVTSTEDNGETFYMVLEGAVIMHDALDGRASFRGANGLVAHSHDPRRPRPVKQSFGEGMYFGGASLFKDARPRPGARTDAFASTATLLACVSEANFPRLLQVDDTVQRQLLAEAKRRLLTSYRTARIPFFCELTDATLARFAELAELVPLRPAQTIDCYSPEARGLYIIADGTVVASVTGETTHHTDTWHLSYGQYFGEMALMLPSAPVTITYTAGAAETTLLHLKTAAFITLFSKDSSLLAELRMKVHQQAASLMTILEHRRARALFIEHLRKSGQAVEARLHFCEAVTQYLQLEPSGFPAAAKCAAEGIVLDYVPDYAMSKIDFEPEVRREMLHALQDGETDKYPELLRRSRDAVYSELERNFLRPFTASEPFLELLHALSDGNDLSDLQHELHEFTA